MTAHILQEISRDARITEMSIVGEHRLSNFPFLKELPHAEIAAWAKGPTSAWFEPARHAWWRQTAVRDHVNATFLIVTMLHGLGDPGQVVPLIASVASGARTYDRIVAPGLHAKALLEQQLGVVRDYLGVSDANAPQIDVVPYGVPDVAQIDPKSAKQALGVSELPMVTYIGRIIDGDKIRFRPFAEALGRAHSRANFELVIAGAAAPPSIRGISEALLSHVPVPNTHIMPNISEAEKSLILSATDVFVSPSVTTAEMFGLSLVEAMLHECSVVASGWGGYLDVISNGRNGILVNAGYNANSDLSELKYLLNPSGTRSSADLSADIWLDYEGLSMAVETLVKDQDIREYLGRQARTDALDKFLISRTAHTVLDLIQESLDISHAHTSQNSRALRSGAKLSIAKTFQALSGSSQD